MAAPAAAAVAFLFIEMDFRCACGSEAAARCVFVFARAQEAAETARTHSTHERGSEKKNEMCFVKLKIKSGAGRSRAPGELRQYLPSVPGHPHQTLVAQNNNRGLPFGEIYRELTKGRPSL